MTIRYLFGREVTAMNGRRRRYQEEEAVELGEVLEPYEEPIQWADEQPYEQNQPSYEELYPQEPVEVYDEYIEDELDHEGRFRIAMGMFDLVSILVGMAVILMLVAMLFTLFNWLKSDVLNSALFIQSGIQ